MRRFSTRTWNVQARINPQEMVVAFQYFKNVGYPINSISGLINACVGFVAQLGVNQGIETPESQDDATYILRQMGHNPSKAPYALFAPKGQPLPSPPLPEVNVEEEWGKVDALQAQFMEEGMEEEEAYQHALKQLGGN